MPSKVNLIVPGQPDPTNIILPEVMIGDDFSEGEEVRVYVENISDSFVRRVSIGLEGDGAGNVSLARAQEDGSPDVWAAAGEGIIAFNGKLPPNEKTIFWAKGVYTVDEGEGSLPFNFLVETISGG